MRAWIWRAFAELSAHELYSILQLRALVFVVEQECAYNDLDGYDAQSLHLFTRDASGRVNAYLRLLPPGVKYSEPSLGRVVTHPELRGSGLGLELMREGLRRVSHDFPGAAVRIGAQRRHEGFYESLGFATVSAPYDEDGIEHVEMLRAS
jgi:ElaA protein